ncbi:hypothetical protein [Chitinophaga qingshengii]|uniref:DUF4595 domain-containing protein n=1 Tax=Chitinophaga qingshengii TaxID=1569794 RepID=A0ABR7TMS3_9BACT|nr:hypothetical protein [Chitinophaga qingshengii]MBC9930925.1 hypothetical protein [Chitinophaga qingshengii]
MKLSSTVLCLVVLVLTACHKNKDVEPDPLDYNNVRIASITNMPPFIYEGDRLNAIGNERFSYDNKGRLIGSRLEYQSGTHATNIYRTTFNWTNNLCTGSTSDSIYSYVTGADGSKQNEFLTKDMLYNIYEYDMSSTQLKTLYITAFGAYITDYSALSFEYDAKGNITRATGKLFAPGGSPETNATIIYEYDNHPNPFYATYKKYGLILPPLLMYADRISPNNVTKMKVKVSYLEDRDYQFTYEYNKAGYPVKIVSTLGSEAPKITYITYR